MAFSPTPCPEYTEKYSPPNYKEEFMYRGATSNTSSIINGWPSEPPGLREYSSQANVVDGNYVINPFSFKLKKVDFNSGRHFAWRNNNKEAELANGEGSLSVGSRTLYKGNFFGGYKHGNGQGAIYDFSTSRQVASLVGEYSGEWKFSFRDGYGILQREDGSSYEGQWKYDYQYGMGMETFPDGSKYVGTWSYGQRNGCGRYYWANGTIEDRDYSNGILVRTLKVDQKEKEKPTKIETELAALKTKSKVVAPTITSNSNSSSGSSGGGGDDSAAVTTMPEKGKVTLKEKRTIKKIQDETVPATESSLALRVGKKIEIEIDWKSFEESLDGKIAVWMLETQSMIFRPIEKVIEDMCNDADAKEVLQSSAKKIRIVNTKSARTTEVKVGGGTIEINGAFEVGPDAKLDAHSLKKLIETKL